MVSMAKCVIIESGEADRRAPILRGLKALNKGETKPSHEGRSLCGEDLYKRGFSTPLLKCINKEQTEYIMNELHNDICGMHCGRGLSLLESYALDIIAPNM